MKSILDPTFKYTNSASTNLAKTFARIRRERAEAAKQAQAAAVEQTAKVQPLVRKART